MVSVNVANQYMIDFTKSEPESSQLNLGTFPAVDQKKPLTHVYQVSGWKSFRSRNCRAAS